MNHMSRYAADHVLEARLAGRIAGALSACSEQLPHDVVERLRFGREQALLLARQARAIAPGDASVVGTSAQGTAVLAGFMPWVQRAASVFPLLLLVFGLLMIDRWSMREQVLAAAEIDAQLLADDLPPAAYGDPGFAEFVRSDPLP